MGTILDFLRRGFGVLGDASPVQLNAAAYMRSVQDQAPRLLLQALKATEVISAQATFTLGNPAPAGRIADALLQTDPEIRAAVKQLKTAVMGVQHVVTAANDTPEAQAIADDLRLDLANPALNLRALKGWIVEHRIRGIGLIEAVWNDPKQPQRTWERFVAVPQQRVRLNRVTGEAQFAETPFLFQGTDVSLYDRGKWIVVQPDEHIQDFALRGIMPALLNDWFARMNVMGWWQQSLERDAMKTLIGKAGSQQDAEAMDRAFKNRGAASAFLIRDDKSSISALDGTVSRSGVSPYGEFMTHTAQRMLMALLGESQTGIIQQNAGSKQSADTQHQIARYVIEDVCNEIGFIGERDLFAPWVLLNRGAENLVNTPKWTPKLDEAVDIVALNEAIAGRPKNVKLGMSWYRQETQWPEPQPGEEPLADPTPAPAFGSAPAVGDAVGTPVAPKKLPPGEPQNPNEKPAGKAAAA